MSRIAEIWKVVETWFHELEHESKMCGSSKPHTSERRDYEADKKHQVKKDTKGAYS